MLANPDPNKHTVEVCFLQKPERENFSSLFSNGDKLQAVPSQNVLGQFWIPNLTLMNTVMIRKCNKMIGAMKNLSLTLSEKAFLTIYKFFVRSRYYL